MASKILLTGRPGVGKTTVVRKLVASGIPLAGGFLTDEIREGRQRVGFRVRDLYSGKEGILAHVRQHGPPSVGKYGVDVECFERIGVAALRQAMDRQGCVVTDEVGKMELCSTAFQEAVAAIVDSDHPLLATIAMCRHPFLDALRARKDVTITEVTRSNRDVLPGQLIGLLTP